MAYVPSYQDDEQQQNPQQPAGSSSAPGASSVGAGGVGSATLPAQQTGAPGSFPGVMGYLRANSDQAAGMAGDAAKKIGDETNTAQSDLSSQSQQWQQANQAALDNWKTTNDQRYRNEYIPTEMGQKQQYILGRTNQDLAGSGDPAARTKWWQDHYNQYSQEFYNSGVPEFAPTSKPSATPWNPDLSKVNAAQTDLNALGTQEGREALLAQKEGGGYYTPGMKALDAALLGVGLQGQGVQQYAPILDALRGQNPTAPTDPSQAPDWKRYGAGYVAPTTPSAPANVSTTKPTGPNGPDVPDTSNPNASPGGVQDRGEWTWDATSGNWVRNAGPRL